MDGSLIVLPSRGWPLSGAQINACNRPGTAGRWVAADRQLHAQSGHSKQRQKPRRSDVVIKGLDHRG